MTWIVLVAVFLAFLGYRAYQMSQAKFQHVDRDGALDLMKRVPVVFLDVRTPAEVKQGKISDAQLANVTAPGFYEKMEKLDKSKHYVVYCRSGSRSMRACMIMSKMGFENVYNLKGGYMAWNK